MLEVEVFGARTRLGGVRSGGREAQTSRRASQAPPSVAEIRRLCVLAAASAGVSDGHLAIEFVDARRIAELNARHREEPSPTDVLAFPIDGAEQPNGAEPERGAARSPAGPRELGDLVICPEHTVDLREAIIHGVLHLVGMDHEADGGEMLALQRELLARASR